MGCVNMKPIQKIPLQQIDLSDETFSVNYLPDLQRLRSSIEQIGINSARAFKEEVGWIPNYLWIQKNFRDEGIGKIGN